MKTIIKNITIAAMAVALFGCQDEYEDINTNARLSASDINVEMQMLDSNWVVFNLLNTQCNPIWFFDDGTQSTVNGFKKQYPVAGDYSVEIKMYNRNGVCDGSIVKELSFTKTFLTFDEEIEKLTDGDSKTWQIAHNKDGHLGCGESADNPTGWWNGTADAKAGTGLYDDKFTFSADGTYTYNPGEDGLTFINYGTSAFGKKEVDEDYDVPTNEQTGTWKFEYRGSTLYLVLSSHSLLGYLAHDSQYEKPEFIVKKVSANEITLVWSCPDISWQYIISPEGAADVPVEKPVWTYNPDGDLTKGLTYETTTYYAHGDSWEGLSTNVLTDKGNGVWQYTLPDASNMQWQAQLAFISQLEISAAKKYDYHVKFLSTTDISGVTVKVTDVATDGISPIVKNIDLEAGVEYEFVVNGVEGQDITVEDKLDDNGNVTAHGGVKFVFDFGGNPANTDITISEMILQESK